MLASSCSGGDSETSEPKLGHVIQNPTGADLTLPLDSYLALGEQSRTIEYAEQLLVGDCMEEQGFAYDVPPRPVEEPFALNQRRYGLIDAQQAAEWGYWTEPDSPEVAALVEANSQLRDEPPEAQQIFLGCLKGARKEIDAERVDIEDNDFVYDLANQSWQTSMADSRAQRAFDEWSDCMADQGYAHAGTPREFSADWISRHQSADDAQQDEGSAEGVAEDPSVVSEDERAAASADVQCKQDVNLAGIWLAAETAYQQRLVDQNSERLSDIKHRLEKAVEQAADVVSGAGQRASN
jgi:hypothetical protein